MSDLAPKKRATVVDLLALPEDAGMELIDGEIVRKALPTFKHGRRQVRVAIALASFDRERRDALGGWWIVTEVDVEYSEYDTFRHDVSGWRRERLATEPEEFPVKTRPDWVCEIISKSNRANDTVRKFRALQKHGVQHYWLLDMEHQTLTVFRWQKDGYLAVQNVCPGDKASLEPFSGVEIDVSSLFGIEPSC